MNQETKNKIMSKANDYVNKHGTPTSHYDDCYQQGAEYGYNLALEQANEILVKALEYIKDYTCEPLDEKWRLDIKHTHHETREALETWQNLTEGEK